MSPIKRNKKFFSSPLPFEYLVTVAKPSAAWHKSFASLLPIYSNGCDLPSVMIVCHPKVHDRWALHHFESGQALAIARNLKEGFQPRQIGE